MSKFSIIVANYNNGRYLQPLIESVYDQTYPDWELIIADDASTDDSVAVIEKYAATDSRIKLIVHPVNSGAGAAFKTATDHSTGEIIGMLGADDALTKDALEIMMKAHQKHPEASLINSQAYDCDGALLTTGICEISGRQAENISLIHEIHIGNFATFKRKAYLQTGGFDPSFQRAVDHDIYLKLEEVGALAFIDKPVYLYRRHAEGISQGDNGMKAANFSLKARMNAYKRRKATSSAPNLSDSEYREIALTYYKRVSNQLRSQKQFINAMNATWQCTQVSPSYFLNRSFWSSLIYNVKGLILH